MQLFYCPDINPSQTYTLNKEESMHCVRVLRLKENDIIHITDGLGNLHKAEIIEALPRACSVRIVETKTNFEQRDYYLHIAIAPTKNIARVEWFLEKATEMGIDEITPIICDNSERKTINKDRLEKILISAMKQSLKAFLPKLNNITTFNQFISGISEKNKLICYCQQDDRKFIKQAYKPKESVLILIGPEGDFSEKEVEMALKNNYHKITLGKQRLRTETAALYAVQSIHLLNQ
jgi:16S rRNA (uracil1498-N3)-methyltransferase